MRYATILLIGLAFTIVLGGCGDSEEAGTASEAEALSTAAAADAPSPSELRAERFAYDGCLSTYRATSAAVALDAAAAAWAYDHGYGGPMEIPIDDFAALEAGCTIAVNGGARP